jgi:O-antigen/teichoic acid export membrane protein
MRARARVSSASSRSRGPQHDHERPTGSRDDLHELARGGVLSFVGTVAGGILSLVLVVVITRGLGTAGTGVFFQAIAVFTILETTARLGADTGLVRAVSRYRALDRTDDLAGTLLVGMAPVLAASIAFAIGVLVFAPQLARVLAGPEHAGQLTTYLRALAPFLPFAAGASVAVAATRGFGTMLPFVALERVGKPLFRPLLAITVIALGMGTVALAIAWALPVAVELPLALGIVAGLLHRAGAGSLFRRRVAGLRRLAADFWGFAAARGLAVLFQILLLWSDVIIVGALRGAREAGIYAAVSRFALMGLFVIEAVRIVIAPQLSALFARGEHDRAQHLYQVGTWWLIAASWPFYLMAAMFAPAILRLFGVQFVEGQTALLILSVAMLLMVGTGGVSVVLLMAGKSTWNLANTLAAVVVNVALNLVLIPRLGITGAALAWAAAILVEKGAALYQVRVLLRLSPFGKAYGAVSLAAIACFGAVGLVARLLLGESVAALTIYGLVATGAYVLVLWRLRHLIELPILWNVLRRRMAGAGEAPVAASTDEGP